MKSHYRAKQLVDRFVSETRVEGFWYEDQDLFLAWLVVLHSKTKASTFQSYRKWLAAYAEHLGFPEFKRSIRGVAAGDAGRPATKKRGLPVSEEDTLSNQELSQQVTPKEMASLATVLMSQRGGGDRYRNGLLSFTWLHITAMTGIRPSEWLNALLLKDVITEKGSVFPWVLEVTTAKKGGGSAKKVDDRESDYRRRLVLDNWSEPQIEALQLFMSQLPSGTTEFRRTQESVRQTLLLACKVANMDPPIGLYTGRHLFASEVRRDTDYNRYQLAAMLGHSDTVNQRYYGDLKLGVERQFEYALPLPWPGEAERVERVDRERYALVYGSDKIVDMMVSTGRLPSV